jgi:hypothetical protein
MRTLTMEEVDRRAGRMYGFVAMIQMLFLITLLVALMSGIAHSASDTFTEEYEAVTTEYRVLTKRLLAEESEAKEIAIGIQKRSVTAREAREWLIEKNKGRERFKIVLKRSRELMFQACSRKSTLEEQQSCARELRKNHSEVDASLAELLTPIEKLRNSCGLNATTVGPEAVYYCTNIVNSLSVPKLQEEQKQSVSRAQAIAARWDIKEVETALMKARTQVAELLREFKVTSPEFKAALENPSDPDRAKTVQYYQDLVDTIEINWMRQRQLEHKHCLLNGGSIEKADICIQEWFDADRSMTAKIRGWSIFRSEEKQR